MRIESDPLISAGVSHEVVPVWETFECIVQKHKATISLVAYSIIRVDVRVASGRFQMGFGCFHSCHTRVAWLQEGRR